MATDYINSYTIYYKNSQPKMGKFGMIQYQSSVYNYAITLKYIPVDTEEEAVQMIAILQQSLTTQPVHFIPNISPTSKEDQELQDIIAALNEVCS